VLILQTDGVGAVLLLTFRFASLANILKSNLSM